MLLVYEIRQCWYLNFFLRRPLPVEYFDCLFFLSKSLASALSVLSEFKKIIWHAAGVGVFSIRLTVVFMRLRQIYAVY